MFFEVYGQWLEYEHMEPELRQQLMDISGNEGEIAERFCCHLSFGTAGIRGILGAGTYRMNVYTVKRATAGLAEYLMQTYGEQAQHRGVAVAYDCRHFSAVFAQTVAEILGGYGIRCYVFEQLAPTPALSFAVGHLHTVAGIVITASHNPPQYNGYKVYNEHGYQIVAEEAEAIAQQIARFDTLESLPRGLEIAQAKEQGLYLALGQEIQHAYEQAVLQQSLLEDSKHKADLVAVYTPLHGAGCRWVEQVLERAGFSGVETLEAQRHPDGDFPTVTSPNPEEPQALALAIERAGDIGADIVFGTDPDGDRVGVAVYHQGQYRLLSGNEMGALLVDYVLAGRQGTWQRPPVMMKTIVTSELGAEIARSYGVEVVETLTGFKYIGEWITQLEHSQDKQFALGYEESYGYLVGTHAKDKDAVVTSLLICEMAAAQKAQGNTLVDRLEQLYGQFGRYHDWVQSIQLEGIAGRAQIARMMKEYHTHPPEMIEGRKVVTIKDYGQGIDGLPAADVMKFILEDGSWMAVRPSGTEPKIKLYYSMIDR